MDFFGAQDNARRQTGLLVVMFIIAVVLIVAAVYAVVAFASPFLGIESYATYDQFSFWDVERMAWVTGITVAIIAGGSLYKIYQLKQGGGKAVAEMLGGSPIQPNTRDPLERRLLHVVEEMAIASGLPVPPVFLLEEAGINAFAAGFSPSDAIIGVTRGSVELLNRDQLQGVMAHEFSHILNGDTTIKMRLIGVLNGITLLSDVGMRMFTGSLSHSTRYVRRRKHGGTSLPWMMLGLVVFLVGTVGLVFGDLIKRAVSRQREFLADAAAVQFTRNPDGVAGALKVIGGFSGGSRIVHPGAGQASHLFFGNALKSLLARDWWATHPPLTDRIRRIEPGFRGTFEKIDKLTVTRRNCREAEALISALAPEPASMPGSVVPDRVGHAVTQVGNPTPEHMQQAQYLLGRLPAHFREMMHEPFAARAVIYALLLDADADMRKAQLRILHDKADPEVFRLTLDLQSECHRLDASLRLPLIDLVIPVLRQMSDDQYAAFRSNVRALIRADEKISMFEYVLHRILLSHLDAAFGRSRPAKVLYNDVQPLQADCARMLAMLAYEGNSRNADAARAYEMGMAKLGLSIAMPLRGQSSLKALNAAINKARQAAPQVKKRIMQASLACVLSDHKVSVAQAELMRAVADGMDCPMPPFLPGQLQA